MSQAETGKAVAAEERTEETMFFLRRARPTGTGSQQRKRFESCWSGPAGRPTSRSCAAWRVRSPFLQCMNQGIHTSQQLTAK